MYEAIARRVKKSGNNLKARSGMEVEGVQDGNTYGKGVRGIWNIGGRRRNKVNREINK